MCEKKTRWRGRVWASKEVFDKQKTSDTECDDNKKTFVIDDVHAGEILCQRIWQCFAYVKSEWDLLSVNTSHLSWLAFRKQWNSVLLLSYALKLQTVGVPKPTLWAPLIKNRFYYTNTLARKHFVFENTEPMMPNPQTEHSINSEWQQRQSYCQWYISKGQNP